MKIYFSIISILRSRGFYSCLNIRHLSIVALLFLSSCGKVVNQNKPSSFSNNISFFIMESQCNQQVSNELQVSKKIKDLYTNLIQNSPQSFYLIRSRSYNIEAPLVLSVEKIQSSYDSLLNDPNLSKKGEDLFYLYNDDRRFEDQKCSFDSLKEKKKFDSRPFFNLVNNCQKKYGSDTCLESEYIDVKKEDENFLRDNIVELCKLFTKDINCQTEYSISQRKKTLGNMINYYQGRFQSERYDTLLKLRPNHSKFNCQATKSLNEKKTIMKIKVLDSSFDHDWLQELLTETEKTWSRNDFELKLELVKNYNSDVVTILPTNKETSYVPDDNNRLIYLSTTTDRLITKRIFVHEFGHVLGFPDCYIEFFDDFKKELIYYEIPKLNTNLMCSLKEGVQVPDAYLSQLAENSCLFN